MESILKLSTSDQREYFEQTANRLGLPRTSIEKDFWVCWTLRELFRLPGWGEHLTFKGGTSLSKGWRLIQRFSEDIDVVVDKGRLGFGGEDSPEKAPSGKARRARLEGLRAACRTAVGDSIGPALKAALSAGIPQGMDWALGTDPDDPDGQTLLFRYPQLFAPGGEYLQAQVKIELGARSDTEPCQEVPLEPYVAEVFQEFSPESRFSVRAVSPERTFWEKAMLLHEETFRPPEKVRRARLARHYYDLWCLIEAGVAESAARQLGLFDRVAAHRQIYFRQTWVDYGTLKPGALRLRPQDGDLAYWTKDYSDMQGEMFFGEVPGFDQVLNVVGRFQDQFNEGQFSRS